MFDLQKAIGVQADGFSSCTESPMNPPSESYPQRPWLVQDIIKERSFTLLGGSSAAGKSTLSCQGVHEWLTSQTFLGFPCYRTPKFWYIAFDRLIEAIYDQLGTMGIFYDGYVDIQSHAMLDLTQDSFTLPQMADGDVLILDGLDFLVRGGNINEFRAVAKLCRQCVQIIRTMGISILGIVGANKQKVGNDETNPFDSLSGSGVWQRVSDTNMVIRVLDPSDPDCDRRVLFIRPRTGKAIQKHLQFSNGWLMPSANPANCKNPDGFLDLLPDGRHFQMAEAIKLGQSVKVSEKTVFNYINYLVDEAKKLEKLSKGTYRKNNRVFCRIN
jgi:hypothetical protein